MARKAQRVPGATECHGFRAAGIVAGNTTDVAIQQWEIGHSVWYGNSNGVLPVPIRVRVTIHTPVIQGGEEGAQSLLPFVDAGKHALRIGSNGHARSAQQRDHQQQTGGS